MLAKDIMVTDFETVHQEALIKEAVPLLYNTRIRPTGFKTLGITVINDMGALVGMLSMFDVIYHLRPPFLNYSQEAITVWTEEIEIQLEQFRSLKVKQVMNSPVETIPHDAPIMVILDLMVKKRVRRLPVVSGSQLIGMVYLSDVFYQICKTWL